MIPPITAPVTAAELGRWSTTTTGREAGCSTTTTGRGAGATLCTTAGR
jgi:hypothetical protein